MLFSSMTYLLFFPRELWLRLKKLFGEEEAKAYHRMVLGTIATRYGLTALFMVVSIFVSRALGVEGRGVISWMVAYSGAGGVFAMLGMGGVLRKYIPRHPQKAAVFIVLGLFLCLFGIMFFMPILYMYGMSLSIVRQHTGVYMMIFLLWPLWVIGNLEGEMLIALKKGLHFNILTIVEKCSYGVICIGLLLFSGISPIAIIGAHIIAASLTVITGFRYLRPHIHRLPSLSELKGAFRITRKLITSSYISNLMGYYSGAVLTVLLGGAVGSKELGYFSTARILTDTLLVIPVTLASFALPHFSEKRTPDEYRRMKWRMFLLTAVCTVLPALFLFFFSYDVIGLLFGKAFLPAGGCLKIMAVGMVAAGVIPMAQSIIISGKNELLLMASTGIQLFCITVLMLIFWRNMNAVTVSYVYSATYVISMVVVLILAFGIRHSTEEDIDMHVLTKHKQR